MPKGTVATLVENTRDIDTAWQRIDDLHTQGAQTVYANKCAIFKSYVEAMEDKVNWPVSGVKRMQGFVILFFDALATLGRKGSTFDTCLAALQHDARRQQHDEEFAMLTSDAVTKICGGMQVPRRPANGQ